MSIFGSIVSAIFGKKPAGTPAGGSAASPSGGSTTGSAAPSGGAAAMSRADVEAMIQKLEDESGQDFNWKQSIVDLMKLLKLDSSLTSRKQLAQELGYTGKLDGSAEMNIWLHKQVMTKLAEGGGKLPDSMRD